ncbi:MAG: HAD-IIIA family hydrolase [Bacteroidota bacterium]|nr:HAD-IIIA family hydrolase [Bacteroidota bacterium]
MNKCVFLDRDGVINKDRVDYVYRVSDLLILDGVKEALATLKKNNYLLIVITNQSGIDRKIFTEKDVAMVHDAIQELTGNYIDEFYYSPYHRLVSNSLSAKPGSLLFEKAISKYNIDIKSSWMVGDRFRDLIPAEKLGLNTILVENDYNESRENFMSRNLNDAVNQFIIK